MFRTTDPFMATGDHVVLTNTTENYDRKRFLCQQEASRVFSSLRQDEIRRFPSYTTITSDPRTSVERKENKIQIQAFESFPPPPQDGNQIQTKVMEVTVTPPGENGVVADSRDLFHQYMSTIQMQNEEAIQRKLNIPEKLREEQDFNSAQKPVEYTQPLFSLDGQPNHQNLTRSNNKNPPPLIESYSVVNSSQLVVQNKPSQFGFNLKPTLGFTSAYPEGLEQGNFFKPVVNMAPQNNFYLKDSSSIFQNEACSSKLDESYFHRETPSIRDPQHGKTSRPIVWDPRDGSCVRNNDSNYRAMFQSRTVPSYCEQVKPHFYGIREKEANWMSLKNKKNGDVSEYFHSKRGNAMLQFTETLKSHRSPGVQKADQQREHARKYNAGCGPFGIFPQARDNGNQSPATRKINDSLAPSHHSQQTAEDGKLTNTVQFVNIEDHDVDEINENECFLHYRQLIPYNGPKRNSDNFAKQEQDHSQEYKIELVVPLDSGCKRKVELHGTSILHSPEKQTLLLAKEYNVSAQTIFGI